MKSPRRLRSLHSQRCFVLLLAFLLVALRPPVSRGAEEPESTVLITPFTIKGAEDMAYLSEALADMLSSRLSAYDGLTVIDAPEVAAGLTKLGISYIDGAAAQKLGIELNADRVIMGTFIKGEEGLTLQATLLDPYDIAPSEAVTVREQALKGLMQGVADLAQAINFRVKGLQVIVSMEVRGNRLIEDAAILYQLPVKKGDVFSSEKIQDSIRAIYDMGYFDDIEVDSSDTPEGKHITFLVEENPELAEIKITGNKEVATDLIQDEIDILPHTILNYNNVKENVLKIKRFYQGKGFYNALVDYNVGALDDNRAALTFSIVEHHPMRVKEVEFVGNEAIKSKKLSRIMETRKKGLLSFITDSGLFKEEALEQDRDRIRAFYYDHGYMDIKVDEPQVTHDDEWIYITIPIDEGPQYTVNFVEITGDLLEDPAVLTERFVSLKPGQVFSRRNIRDDMAKLSEFYGEFGYAFADITPLTNMNAEERTIGVTYDIAQGDAVYFEDINITGNTRTRDKVIRRELRIKEEELYSNKKLNRSRERLDNLGYFEEVAVNTRRGSAPDKIDVDVEVKEKPTGMISMGAGYSSVDSIVAMFQVSQENFLGKGLRATFMAQVGGNNRYRIGITNPYLFDKEISAGFNIFRTDVEYDDFDTTSTGFDLGVGFRPFGWDDWRLGFSYELSETEVSDINYYCADDLPPANNPCDDPFDPNCENPADYYEWPEICDCDEVESNADLEIAESEGTTTISSFTTTLSLDTVDNRFYPMRGSVISTAFQIAGGPFFGPEKFYKISFDSRRFFPFKWGTAFMARGAFGYVDSYSGSEVPVFERFFLGGLDSLRGYEYRTVGPRGDNQFVLKEFNNKDTGGTCTKQVRYTGESTVGGNKMLLFNFEYLFPIVKAAKIRGLIFYDIGNAFADGETLDLGDLKAGVGAGFRWNSPFGPLRVEWGYALDAEDDEDTSQFEFSIGTGF